jgi:hypothetical protein
VDDSSNVTRESGTFQSLTRAVRTFPTPGAQDSKHRDTEHTARQRLETGKQIGLHAAVILERQSFPTPKARDWKDGASEGTFDRTSPDLGKVVGQAAATGALNPTWVELLMGFPPGWTDIESEW